MATRTFSKGESVIHAGKPEWGPGDIVSAEGQLHEGKPCQRLTIRFARAGLKTISTAFADLRPASEAPLAAFAARMHAAALAEPMESTSNSNFAARERGKARSKDSDISAESESGPESEPNMQDVIDRNEAQQALQKLPENINDPFLPLMKRVQATLGVYKYWDKPAGVLDWATAQTGLRDPMSAFNRHELEAQMDRFRIALDGHFKKLLKDARREDAKALEQAVAAAGPAAKAALRRVDIGR
ncbi:MAG: DUF3553 domain-containing protein [Phycisphaerales bacterium]